MIQNKLGRAKTNDELKMVSTPSFGTAVRGDTIYINEPHPSGGAVIASFPVGQPSKMTFYLNDMLGTTLATAGGGTIRYARLSAFGQQLEKPSVPQPSAINLPSPSADFSQNNPNQPTNPSASP